MYPRKETQIANISFRNKKSLHVILKNSVRSHFKNVNHSNNNDFLPFFKFFFFFKNRIEDALNINKKCRIMEEQTKMLLGIHVTQVTGLSLTRKTESTNWKLVNRLKYHRSTDR